MGMVNVATIYGEFGDGLLLFWPQMMVDWLWHGDYTTYTHTPLWGQA
jgi:hypothetical protein